jgi:hypothetical protein
MTKRKVNYNQLKAKYYKKLKDSGFKDIEHGTDLINSGVPYLIRVAENKTTAYSETAEYYYMCQCFLHEHTFDTTLEKVIWEYYTEGLSYRQIESTLLKVKIKNYKRDKIWRIIKRLESLMKARYLSI